MPSKSDKQRRFMAAAANNPKFAKKVGIKSGVAKEFYNADRQKFAYGGLASAMRPMLQSRLSGGPATGMAQRSGPKLQPARAVGPQPGFSRFGGYGPPLVQNGALGAAVGRLGVVRPSQQVGMGRFPVSGGIPAQVPNGLLATSDRTVNHAGDRLRRLKVGAGPRRFAKGGSVGKGLYRIWDNKNKTFVGKPYSNKSRARARVDKLDNEYGAYRYMVKDASKDPEKFAKGGAVKDVKKALTSLKDARLWLTENSDEPDFNEAIKLLNAVPGTSGLKARIKRAQRKWDNPETNEEEITRIFLDLDEQLKRHQTSLSGTPSKD